MGKGFKTRELTHACQVMRNAVYWHTMCAFDCEQAATNYVQNCRTVNGSLPFVYRVINRRGNIIA